MRVKRLVIGSRNKAKFNEWREILGDVVEVVDLSSYDFLESPIEDGSTLLENAKKKAVFYAKNINEYVLSEDGGFEVDALGGAPGVRGNRILPGGKRGTDMEIVEFVLAKMKKVKDDERGARLGSAVVISDPEGKVIYEGKAGIDGFVSRRLRVKIIPGYPYRSILFLPDIGKTYSEISETESKKLGHKKKLKKGIKKVLNKHQ